MRKFGEVTIAPNNGQRLTIPIKTRTPQEAFEMFRAGQPVDNMAGYYATQGEDTTDFHLLDKIGKLQKLNEYREIRAEAQVEINSLKTDINESIKLRAERDTREVSQRGNSQINHGEQNEPGQLLRETRTSSNQAEVPQILNTHGDSKRDIRTP